MPTISFFYGLIIQMFWEKNSQHNLPHIHVKYAEYNAVFNIENGEILSGELPISKKKLVEAWIEIHKEELFSDWQLALEGQALFKIDPLK